MSVKKIWANFLLTILIFEYFTMTLVNAQCSVAIKDLKKQPPNGNSAAKKEIFFEPVYINEEKNDFHYPINKRGEAFIEVKGGKDINLWCSGEWEMPAGAPNMITATCVRGNEFKYKGTSYEFNKFVCKDWPQHSLKNTNERCFDNKGILIDVGFQVEQQFLKIYTVCHDPVLKANLYSHFKLLSVKAEDGINPRGWINDEVFYPKMGVHDLYGDKQISTIESIFNDENAGIIIINYKKQLYLSRGHLAAKSDFIFATHQRATYEFINVAPQWQKFNEQNWAAIETWSKNILEGKGSLDVYTGTIGTLSLSFNRVSKEIYLDFPSKRIPVPKFYYRIMINNESQKGVVFYGHNNPYLPAGDCTLCPNQNGNMKFSKSGLKKFEDIENGYICTCTVKDFLQAVPKIIENNSIYNAYNLLQWSK